MGESIETYIKRIITTLKCSEEEKNEIEEEMRDHLYLLMNDYLAEGYSENEAIKKAINIFGEENDIRKGLQSSLSPFYKLVNWAVWIAFSTYIIVLFGELVIRRLIIRFNNGPNYYFFNPDYSPLIPDTSPNIFNKEVFLLNTNFIPFRNISDYILNHDRFNLDIVIHNTVGNILIFVPLGFFLPLLIKKNINFFKASLFFIIVSFSIELLQYGLIVGQFDIDDIILNSIGGIVGLLIIRLSIQFTYFCKNITHKLQYQK
ncbi:VanZ family protein [Metabacillus litoralis]|uniref:VanZ family protein n=1 Tax=Metabacillus litoralis TaxID=152268 RepID=UPI00203CCC4B|nr:VanZ family protein [Metabacillus litoralis]MCM3412683.1 VanZ family protein [Metabacillus litoralis]